MTIKVRCFRVVVCVVILFGVPSFAQTLQRLQANSPPQAQEQQPSLPPNANSIDAVANEIGLPRKSLAALNARLREILELIEKETTLKSRLVQIDEDMRPESIERALNPYGTTRTAELRDARRRILENDRRGVESLLNLTTQSRIRLEDDVKQADLLVFKLRQRVLPLIDKEIEKINPN